VELAVATLRRHGYMLKQQRVHDLPGLQAALEKGTWDVLLSEYQLPHFSAQMAFDALRRAGSEAPVLIFTRSIPDAEVVKIMRLGIADVVQKTTPARLAPAIERELKALENLHALREARSRLKELEGKNRAIIEGAREAFCYIQDGMHVEANHTYLELFGYENLDELSVTPVMNLFEKTEHVRFKDIMRKAGGGKTEPQELSALKANGSRFSVEISFAPVEFNGEKCLQMVVADVSRRKAVEVKLQYLNQHDPLTGLFNRHYFVAELGKTVELVKQGKESATVLYMDMQQVKSINDKLGYGAGDRMLIKVARLFREHLGEEPLLARFGGDEFAALLRGAASSRGHDLAESLKQALQAERFSEGDTEFSCDCHLSVTPVDRQVESAQALLSRAYQAAQVEHPAAPAVAPPPAPAAEKPPAPAVVRSKPAAVPASVKPVPVAANNWSGRLLTAIEKGSFTLNYQPIVNLHADPEEQYEILVRLVGDDGNLVNAGEFIPAAEQCGLVPAIDRWVIRNSIEALAALHREGRRATLFVNLSRDTLKDADLLPLVIQWLRESGAKADYLVFEADEPDLQAEPRVATFIKAARKMGCHFCIDNFGKNLGATDHLRDLPVEYLKIDGSFIRDLSSDPVSQTALRAVLQVAQALNMKTIAKCVEKAENLSALWNFGIDYVQGFYFDNPDAGTDAGQQTTLSAESLATPNWASGTRG
jgi:diguanylate cyclase (GGDEF)-like protein/PAS domain S-box-containing protein